MMVQKSIIIETAKLVNNSIISAIDKLNVKDGDTLIFKIKTWDGDILPPLDQVRGTADFVNKYLNQNFDNVKALFVPDWVYNVEIEKCCTDTIEGVIK